MCLTAAQRTRRFLEEVEKRFLRCGRCVAVREKEKKVSHGGTATTAFLEEVEKKFGRCGRCVAVRKKRRGALTAAQRTRRF